MQSTVAIRAQPLVCKVASQKVARQQVIVKAQSDEAATSRRAALALAAAAVIGFAAVENAQAGGAPKSLTRSSMSSYSMEGTKKQGISPKRKAKLIAKLKKRAANGAASE